MVGAVYAQNDLVFLGVGQRLVILDVSDPASPRQVGATRPLAGPAEAIAISQDRAYIANGGGGLQVVDLTDPAQPQVLRAWDSPGYAEDVAVAGAFAFLADGPYGLQIVDISDPADPRPVASAYDMNNALGVTVSADFAYLAVCRRRPVDREYLRPASPR